MLDSNDRPEDHAIDIDATVEQNIGPIVIGLGTCVLVLLVAVLWLWRRSARLSSRLDSLTRGEDGGSLETVIEAHLDRVGSMARGLEDVTTRTRALEAAWPRAFQRVGLVRYNPFEDTGGNQSFALALLDANGDGWVLSSLHARSGTRVYAKAITRGRSDGALSDEEAAAVRQASA